MNRTFSLRLAIITGFSILSIFLACALLVPHLRQAAQTEPAQLQRLQAPQPEENRPGPSADEIRQKSRDRARLHLDAAEKESKIRVAATLQPLQRFFHDAKRNSPPFAEEALSWRSKWRLVADYLPFTDSDGHEKFLRAKFHEHLFAPDQLEAAVRRTIKSYLDDLQSIENRMLVDLQADLSDLPPTLSISTLNRPQLEVAFHKAIQRAREQIASDLKADIGTELVSLIAGEVLTRVAVRLGLSASILGTGAASGCATVGVGVVIGLIVDQIVSWV